MQSSSYDAARRTGGWLSPCSRRLLVALFSMGFFCSLAQAAEGQIDPQAEVWATACLSCHSAPKASDQRHIPSLYGMQASRIESQMRAYASGEKPGLLMQQLAKGYDPDVLHRIALWFQNTPKE